MNSQRTLHSSPLRVSYGVSFVSILEEKQPWYKGNHDIKAVSCMYSQQTVAQEPLLRSVLSWMWLNDLCLQVLSLDCGSGTFAHKCFNWCYYVVLESALTHLPWTKWLPFCKLHIHMHVNEKFVFSLKSYWSLFPSMLRVQLTIYQH